MSVPRDFLAKFRPGGPWVLTAIVPDGQITTITACTTEEVDAFVRDNDGKRNLYYSVNPTRTVMTKKAKKTDIAAIEYALADLDPGDGETPEAAKARYLAQLEGTFEPKPTALVDSGNGIQGLWKLRERIVLGEPVNGKFAPEDQAKIDDVEARVAVIMVRLGAKAGTQNVDRILRLPGTTNLPNKKKRDTGRVACPTKLISFNGAAYPLKAFPLKEGRDKKSAKTNKASASQVDIDALDVSERIKNLIRGIDDPAYSYDSRSERVMAVLVAMAAADCTDEQMAAVMFDKALPIGEHVREQSKPREYLVRQIGHARAKASEGGPRPGGKGKGKTHATLLLAMAAQAELFHTPDGTGFADFEIRGHRETWPIRSKTFRQWLSRCFYQKTGGAPSSEARTQALNIIEAMAQHDGEERVVSVRVAGHGDKLYLDLADVEWRAVEIDADGWRVVSNPPVRFRRAAGMRPLPLPVRGGAVGDLRAFLNVQSDTDFTLIVVWVLAALRDCGPYPVLVVVGEQGSAKSILTAIVRRLVDPNTAPLRALPREERDLFIAAGNAHVLAYDNVSGLPHWISDALCRLSTGGGFATRELHTDQDEILFDAVRPVILNGIEDVVTRPDLADRAVMLTLAPISDEMRRTEKEIWTAFDKVHPLIFGRLLDGVSHGLRMLPTTELVRKPRMADFALWATACEGELDLPCTFETAYSENRAQAVETVIDTSPIADAVRTLMRNKAEWEGTATDLLEELGSIVGDNVRRSKQWPGAAHVLMNRLRRVAAVLRKVGITIEEPIRQGHESKKIIHITKTPTSEPELPF